jgi:hypothetical protein
MATSADPGRGTAHGSHDSTVVKLEGQIWHAGLKRLGWPAHDRIWAATPLPPFSSVDAWLDVTDPPPLCGAATFLLLDLFHPIPRGLPVRAAAGGSVP